MQGRLQWLLGGCLGCHRAGIIHVPAGAELFEMHALGILAFFSCDTVGQAWICVIPWGRVTRPLDEGWIANC